MAVPQTNKGLKYLSQEIVYHELENLVEMAKQNKVPIISIGSGRGHVEKFIMEEFKFPHVICVDPDPESWKNYEKTYSDIALPPDFATVQHLIEKHPEHVGQCMLLLNWCFPNTECGSYDVHALNDLRPLAFLSIYETVGGAGSSEFHTLASQMTPPAPADCSVCDREKFPVASMMQDIYGCDFYHEEICPKDIYCIALCKKISAFPNEKKTRYIPFDQVEMDRRNENVILDFQKQNFPVCPVS